jgi:hypothetical protein
MRKRITGSSKSPYALIVTVAALAVTPVILHNEGRSWWCGCKQFIWIGSICSSLSSQAFLDPFSFTHVLHGFLMCGILALVFQRLSWSWRFSLAIVLECGWEILENSQFIIDRYRFETAQLGYAGDTVMNSLGDISCCALGFLIASRLGFRRALITFAMIELILVLWLRDSLLLEIVMLVRPIATIKTWQLCV